MVTKMLTGGRAHYLKGGILTRLESSFMGGKKTGAFRTAAPSFSGGGKAGPCLRCCEEKHHSKEIHYAFRKLFCALKEEWKVANR